MVERGVLQARGSWCRRVQTMPSTNPYFAAQRTCFGTRPRYQLSRVGNGPTMHSSGA